MSGYQAGNGYQNGNGGGNGAKTPKLPQLGEGRLRKVNKSSDKSPDFRGFANLNGQMVSISIWYQPAAQKNGQMLPEGWSLKIQPYTGEFLPPDPPRQQNGGQQGWGNQPPPQQQSFGYGQQQPHQAPPQYGAPPQPNGYGAAPPQQGYQRAPQAGPPPQYQPPQNGGYAPTSGQQGASYGGRQGMPNDEIPF